MKKLIPFLLLLLLALTLLITLATPQDQADGPAASEAEQQKVASKIDEAVLTHLWNNPDEPLTVIVHIGGEADLSGAAAFTNYAHKGPYVNQT